jgi:hypothetical protein
VPALPHRQAGLEQFGPVRRFLRERSEFRVFRVRRIQKMEVFMPALIMWLLGVPITVIILLYLLF